MVLTIQQSIRHRRIFLHFEPGALRMVSLFSGTFAALGDTAGVPVLLSVVLFDWSLAAPPLKHVETSGKIKWRKNTRIITSKLHRLSNQKSIMIFHVSMSVMSDKSLNYIKQQVYLENVKKISAWSKYFEHWKYDIEPDALNHSNKYESSEYFREKYLWTDWQLHLPLILTRFSKCFDLAGCVKLPQQVQRFIKPFSYWWGWYMRGVETPFPFWIFYTSDWSLKSLNSDAVCSRL
jgi:hypothetical protein